MEPGSTQPTRSTGTRSTMVELVKGIGFVTKTWPDSRNKDQQNKTMQAVVTVFGIVF